MFKTSCQLVTFSGFAVTHDCYSESLINLKEHKLEFTSLMLWCIHLILIKGLMDYQLLLIIGTLSSKDFIMLKIIIGFLPLQTLLLSRFLQGLVSQI